MKADPDFHTIAAAWLEGTATPPEQRLLDELLTAGPAAVEDYAALCRTEALLHQAGRTAAERRKSLAAMLSGKPWPQRVAGFLKSRTVRWAAAAAVVVLATWALWPAPFTDGELSGKRRLPHRTPVAGKEDSPALPFTGEPALPPPAAGLESRLKRFYMEGFKTVCPLKEAAAKVAGAVVLNEPERKTLTTDVRDAADAPVHLKHTAPLPAWTLLQMMALQTGTTVELSGKSVVFRAARKPVPATGVISRTVSLFPLRTLLGLEWRDEHVEELAAVSALAEDAYGGKLEFEAATGESIKYTGTPRDAQVLSLALNATANPPVLVRFEVKVVSIPPGQDLAPTADKPAVSGIFTGAQFQTITQNFAETSGVDLMTYPAMLSKPNGSVEVNNQSQDRSHSGSEQMTGLHAKFAVFPQGDDVCTFYCAIEFTLPGKGKPSDGDIQKLKTQLLMQSGQTLGLGGFRQADGHEMLVFVTPALVDYSGADPDPVTPPAPPAPKEELPYGIPVIGEKGKVQSPYAPEKGFVDVDGYKRGTRVECPYTGKHFRVP